MNPVKKFALTAACVTRLPLCSLPEADDSETMAGLSKYLPAVGLLVGAILFGLSALLDLIKAEPLLSAAVLTVAWLLLTGGIHFDGLMDTADGIFSHRDQKRMLEIMADSRVGNFGAMAGWCVLLLKFAALGSLATSSLAGVLLVVPAWARWCETYAIGAFPYLRREGMGKVWHDTTRFPRDLILSSIIPLAATVWLQHQGWCLAAPAAIATIACGLAAMHWLKRILGGQTGDTYGATVELAEAGALLLIALTAHLPCLPL